MTWGVLLKALDCEVSHLVDEHDSMSGSWQTSALSVRKKRDNCRTFRRETTTATIV